MHSIPHNHNVLGNIIVILHVSASKDDVWLNVNHMLIGSNGTDFLNGVIDELKLYNYALTADEIKKEYTNIDDLSIIKDGENKIANLKVKGTVDLTVIRKLIDTNKNLVVKDAVFKSSDNKIFKF